jgi:hypothetical protein
MPFPYYDRLSARQKAIYRESDRIADLRVPDPPALWPGVVRLRTALAEDSRPDVAAAAQALSRDLLAQLQAPALTIKVLAVRPSRSWGELHGLYTSGEDSPAEIRLWMRTARHRRVVAFRTFLRTLLHELCHHLDYHALRLRDSYHTQGFFRRESSLFRQLVPEGQPPRAAAASPQAEVRRPGRAAGKDGASQTGRDRRGGPAGPESDRQRRIAFDGEGE